MAVNCFVRNQDRKSNVSPLIRSLKNGQTASGVKSDDSQHKRSSVHRRSVGQKWCDYRTSEDRHRAHPIALRHVREGFPSTHSYCASWK